MTRAAIWASAKSWTASLLSAAGLTLLCASSAALFGPLPWLDAAIARTDAQLAAGLSLAFALALILVRLASQALRPRPIAPRRSPAPKPPSGRSYLR